MNSLNQRIDMLERALRATGPVASSVPPPGNSSADTSTPASADSLVAIGEDGNSPANVESSSIGEGMICNKALRVPVQSGVSRTC